MAAVGLFNGLTGYRGKRQPRVEPKSLAEAWTDVEPLVWLIFVVTFLVLLVRNSVRRARSEDQTGL